MKRVALSVLALSAITVGGCQQIPTPAQSQAFRTLDQAWVNEARMSERGAEAMLADGEVTEAGKVVLDARREAFGQLIADLLSGGK